jgi:transposase
MSEQMALALPPYQQSEAIVINGRCTLRVEGEWRVIVVAGLVVHSYSAEDAIAEAYAMVLLVDAGYAQQNEIARAFGCSERTVRRHQQRYRQGGMAQLNRREGWRAGRRRIECKRLRLIERLKAEGTSNREIARRLGVDEKAIRQIVGPSEAAAIKLATERKHLTDIIKMVGYQAESDLLIMLRPHYSRADQEGRTLLHELFAAAADIAISGDELHIALAPLSSPHRTAAVQALCEPLNSTATKFPGTNLYIRFDVRPSPRVGLAFPGPAPSRG